MVSANVGRLTAAMYDMLYASPCHSLPALTSDIGGYLGRMSCYLSRTCIHAQLRARNDRASTAWDFTMQAADREPR